MPSAIPTLTIKATHPRAVAAVRYWISLVDHAGLPGEKKAAQELLASMIKYRDLCRAVATSRPLEEVATADDRGATTTSDS